MTSTPPPDDGLNGWRREELIWALRWLAADPDAAIAAVPNVCTADEIALDIDHWFEVATGWGLIEPDASAAIAKIDDGFKAMTDRDDPALWTDEAVSSSTEWATQRVTARDALAALGAERMDDALGMPRDGGPVYVTAADWPLALRERLSALRDRLFK